MQKQLNRNCYADQEIIQVIDSWLRCLYRRSMTTAVCSAVIPIEATGVLLAIDVTEDVIERPSHWDAT